MVFKNETIDQDNKVANIINYSFFALAASIFQRERKRERERKRDKMKQ
jgi:hypothetical protein